MNYTVIEWDEVLHIVDEKASPIYHLDPVSLQKISQADDVICSGCIFHLASYGILPTHILYQVAAHIQRQFPDLQIDWFTTFYYVEKNSYLTVAFRMKEMLQEPDFGYYENRLTHFCAFEESDPVDCVDAFLMKVVMMNMINFNVKAR